jgi:hypothetical protein
LEKAMPTDRKTISFRSIEIEKELYMRDLKSPGRVASRDLERYYFLIREELADINFTEDEVALIAAALYRMGGPDYEEYKFVNKRWVEADHYIRSIAEQENVEKPILDNLLQKWSKLSRSQFFAIHDAVERLAKIVPDCVRPARRVIQETRMPQSPIHRAFFEVGLVKIQERI